MKIVKTWRLKTPDNIDVNTDGNGHFSLEVLPEFSPVEFKESDHQHGSLETYRERNKQAFGSRLSLGSGSGYLRMTGGCSPDYSPEVKSGSRDQPPLKISITAMNSGKSLIAKEVR